MPDASPEDQFYKEAFKRNIGLISKTTQHKLRNTHVAICGMGGVGGVHSETLARLGVGNLTIADGDTFELANENRQMEAMESTLGRLKNDVMLKTLHDINPFATIRTFGYITVENVDAFLEGVSIIIDGIDFFEFDVRRLIFNKAREKGITVITAAPVGFGSSVLVFTKDSMSFDEYFDVSDTTPNQLKPFHFGVGLTPSLLQRSYFAPTTIKMGTRTAPSSILGTLAAATWAGTIVFKIIDGKEVEVAPVSLHFDPYVSKLKRINLYNGNRNIIQRIKLWYLQQQMLKK